MNIIFRLQAYMGKRKILLPSSLLLAGLSSLFTVAPLVFIWLIVKELLTNNKNPANDMIAYYGWCALGTALIAITLYFLALTLSHLAAFRVEVEMRRQAMDKIVRMPLGFFDRNTSGKIRKIVDDNASTTHTFLAHQLPDLAATLSMPVLLLVLLFMFDWRLGLATLLPVFVAMTIMGIMMGLGGKSFMRKYLDALEQMNTEAVEYVRGIPIVKVFQQTVYSFKNFHKAITDYREMVFQYTLQFEKPMTTYLTIVQGIVYVLVPVGILLLTSAENYTEVLVNIIFYIILTPLFAQTIMRSMHFTQNITLAKEAVDRVENLISAEVHSQSSHPKPISSYGINFNNVSFTYPGKDTKAIDSISFTIKAGQHVTLVGASGSGKTTIARLIPRFWDVDSGEVIIGANNVKEISNKELMQNVSFVFQNNKLFKTTLLENLRYGNESASMKEVERALDRAQCREIIERLPQGLQTKIGAEGTYLSGGEQQRVALARAILKNAPIVVLDEATAFSDPENEHLIQKALKELMQGKTVLMIAHRLSSVVESDTILVLSGGKIAEKGRHEELLNNKGLYLQMWNEYKKSVEWTIKKEAV
ncbi:MAG: ABC transporter ATP-binding protein [Pseudomonadota bacterium]